MASAKNNQRDLSVSEALALAVQLHRGGQLAQAETIYRRILTVCPDHPDTLHYLGVLLHQQKKSAEAIELINKAIALAPDQPDFHNNLGNVFKELGRLAEAASAYRKVIALQSNSAAAYNNLGTVLKDQEDLDGALAAYRKAIALQPDHIGALLNLGSALAMREKLDEAIAAYEKVIDLNPTHAEAYYRLGHIYWDQGKYDEAAAVFQKTTDLDPHHPDAYFVLGNLFHEHTRYEEAIEAYRKSILINPRMPQAYRNLGLTLNILGRIDEAADVWEQWLKNEPDNPIPQYMLAAATGRNVPTRAGDDFIQKTFDSFARTFDKQLKRLSYHAPDLIAEAIAKELGPPTGELEVLDAGCGTGLCAPLLRPYARHLMGVDLSAGMIEKARERGGYDDLVTAELTDFMSRITERYDLLASADTLVYFGDLKPVFQAAAKTLRSGGHFVFTLEKAPDADGGCGFVLHLFGRYCHKESYVQTCLSEAGFAVRSMSPVILRMEAGKPVDGILAVARKEG